MYCRWFVKCENVAIGLAPHPVFTAVPICYRCAMKMGIEVPLPTCALCGADVPVVERMDLDYDERLYCSHACWMLDNVVDPDGPEAARFAHEVALQTRY